MEIQSKFRPIFNHVYKFAKLIIKKENEGDSNQRLVLKYGELSREKLESDKRLISLAYSKSEKVKSNDTANKSMYFSDVSIMDISKSVERVLRKIENKNALFKQDLFTLINLGLTAGPKGSNIFSFLINIFITLVFTFVFTYGLQGFIFLAIAVNLLVTVTRGMIYTYKAANILANNDDLNLLVYQTKLEGTLIEVYQLLKRGWEERNPVFLEVLANIQLIELASNIKTNSNNDEVKKKYTRLDNNILVSWNDFLIEVMNIPESRIKLPKCINDGDRQIWIFKIKGLNVNNFQSNKQMIESYTNLYVHAMISGFESPGDVAVIVAPFKAPHRFERQYQNNDVTDNNYSVNGTPMAMQSYYNPSDIAWKGFINNNFPKYKERYETPQYFEDETTELHLMRIKGITEEDYRLKEKDIESELGKRVYAIYPEYRGKTGVIGIEMITGSFPTLISYSEAKTLFDESSLILGKDVKGFVTWNYVNQPHALIVGATRSGKGINVQNLIRQVKEKNYMMMFADFKDGIGFNHYLEKGYLVIEQPDEFADTLGILLSEMSARYHIFKKNGVTSLQQYFKLSEYSIYKEMPRIFCFIDELSSVTLNNDKELVKSSTNMLSELLAKSGAAGIHLVLITHSPDVSSLGGAVNRRNLSLIMTGRLDSNGSNLIFKDDRAYRKIPTTNFQGLFIAQGASRDTVFKTPFMEEVEFQKMVRTTWGMNPYMNYEWGIKVGKSEMDVKFEDQFNNMEKQSSKEIDGSYKEMRKENGGIDWI